MKLSFFGGALLTVLFSSCEPLIMESNTLPHAPPSAAFEGHHQPQVMILGVFHFDNPGLDAYQEQFEVDVLSPQNQEELAEIRQLLSAYQPTKIMLEYDRVSGDSLMNESYQGYLNGTVDISQQKNEWYQLGFKLGRELGHQKLYCIDAKSQWCGPDLDWDTYQSETYLQAHQQFEKAMRYNYDSVYRHDDSLKAHVPLRDYFITDNTPANRLKDHQAYLTQLAIEGAGDHYVGAASVGNWYTRNLKIFANVYDLADFNTQERILIIFGSGHVWQLRQFFTDSPDFDYIEVNTYLDPK